MIWRAGSLLLVAHGASFVVIDGAGATVSSYEPRTYSDEDDLWRWMYLVEGDRFIERTTVETRGVARDKEEVLLQGLVSADDLATLAFVSKALDRKRGALDEARAAAAREADARIAAIPGALDELGLGELLARAQTALVDRVRWYADPVAAGLLTSLVVVARARPDERVIAAFARGCLHACFMRDVPERSYAMAPHDPALAAEIARWGHALDREAEDCEAADALGNARCYRAAALEMWVAADALDPPRP